MTTEEMIALVASITSLILAVCAIWLSIAFYKMSNEASRLTNEAARGIDASVVRLEKLFDKLYSDTFSIMKDTVTDMRRHIWNVPSDDAATVSDEMREEIRAQVAEVLEGQPEVDPAQLDELKQKLESALKALLEKSREAKLTKDSQSVMAAIREHGPLNLESLAKVLGVPEGDVVDQVFALRREGTITWSGSENALSNSDLISFVEEE